MATVTFNTVLNSDALGIPELLPLAGKRVEIRVTEETDSAIDRMLDTDIHAFFEAEDLADTSPVMSIEEIQAMLACIPGSMAEEVIADREER
jgi:hypothetical protein